jgi:electron transfer flavoprotein beta subunit
MKILVCIKQVPAKDSPLRLTADSKWIRDADLSFEINEPDTFALEEALQLKEKHGGEVVAASVGPARVQQAIREALSKGADRAIHIDDDSGSKLDSFFTARLIAEAVRAENFGLILTGLQSDDLGFAQTGVILAELLGLPHATIIMEVQVLDAGGSNPSPERERRVKVKRELEAGWFQWVEMPMPALLTIQSGINKPRYATLKGIKGAKSKEIRRVTAADLGLKPEDAVPQSQLRRVYVPVKTKKTEFIEGPPKEAAAKLVEKLQREARVL